MAILALGHTQSFFPVPETYYIDQADSLRFLNLETLTYVRGLGWLSPDVNLPLIETDGVVYAPAEFFDLLGLKIPRLTAIRDSSGEVDRVVFELSNLDSDILRSINQAGPVNGSLSLELPFFLRPLELQLPNYLDLSSSPTGNQVVIESDAIQYKLFSLENPQRIVIDLFKDKSVETRNYPLPETAILSQAVTYRRILFPTIDQISTVHILDIAPNQGSFKVVGHLQGGAKLSELASGAYAAINAGYFDPNSFNSIGYLKIDFGTLSLPSRNRAVAAFEANQISMDRVSASLELYSATKLKYRHNLNETDVLSLHQESGVWVGRPDVGVITVKNGLIIENKVGPRQVPENGFALVYSPKIRELALLNEAEPLSYSVHVEPQAFASSRYAIEAGPLLYKNGLDVYQPELEQFKTGARILEAVTQQSVIATTFTGTTLFIVAENMTAADLLPLLASLGVKDAMRLDSGSSSGLWANQMLLNRNNERRITSAIVFIPETP